MFWYWELVCRWRSSRRPTTAGSLTTPGPWWAWTTPSCAPFRRALVFMIIMYYYRCYYIYCNYPSALLSGWAWTTPHVLLPGAPLLFIYFLFIYYCFYYYTPPSWWAWTKPTPCFVLLLSLVYPNYRSYRYLYNHCCHLSALLPSWAWMTPLCAPCSRAITAYDCRSCYNWYCHPRALRSWRASVQTCRFDYLLLLLLLLYYYY